MILRFLGDLLADDFYVLTADSGESALEQSKAFEGQIHLLLTDVMMPNMNGVELANQITTQRPEIKVVIMSGFTGDILIPNPMWHFIAKPFEPTQLITLVNRLIAPPKSGFAIA